MASKKKIAKRSAAKTVQRPKPAPRRVAASNLKPPSKQGNTARPDKILPRRQVPIVSAKGLRAAAKHSDAVTAAVADARTSK